MFLLQEILARQTWVELGPKESIYGAEWSLHLEPERGEEFTLVAFRRGETIRLMSDISGEWYVCILSEDDSKRFLSVIVVADPQPALPVFGGG